MSADEDLDEVGPAGEGRELVRPPAPNPMPLGVGHVLLHVQLPPDVDLDVFAGRLKAGVRRLDERAIAYAVVTPARTTLP